MKLRIDLLALVMVLTAVAWVGSAEAQDDAARARETLRKRLDLTASRIVLEPSGEATLAAAPAEAFDRRRFAQGLAELFDGAELVDQEVSESHWRAEGKDHLVDVDLRRRQFVVRDKRGIFSDEAGSLVSAAGNLPPDHVLTAKARQLLASLGANPAQTASFEVVKLGAAEHPAAPEGAAANEPEAKVTMVAKKVFIQRTVGEIPVLGDQMVVTFGLDGSFRKLLGRWRAIDYDASQLRSAMSQAQFVERALDALVEHGVDPESRRPITLATGYGVHDAAPGIFALQLKGLAVVELQGPDGSTKVGVYDFDL